VVGCGRAIIIGEELQQRLLPLLGAAEKVSWRDGDLCGCRYPLDRSR
jgi:hypothetical protein